MKSLCWLWLGTALISGSAWSWSAKGHGDIALAALDALPESVQIEYRQLLQTGPWAKGSSNWRIAAARAAAWPDRIRDEPLRKLFGRYGSGKVPAALTAYRQDNTNDWHYTNALYLSTNGEVLAAAKGEVLPGSREKGASCPPPAQGRLLRVWPDLVVAYRQSEDPRDRALVLVFILHLLADSYQPLHLLASLDASCKHDRGGNAYCLAPARGFHPAQRCEQSLHFLWDQGFGVFDGKLKNRGQFQGSADRLDAVIARVESAAPDVYPRRPEEALRSDYTRRGRIQVEKLGAHAVAHMTALLLGLASNGRT